MLTAQMTIGDLSGQSVIGVEILKIGPRPGTAWVRALGGIAPFTRYTHGGPAQEDTALVLIPHLVNLEVLPEVQVENVQAQPIPESAFALEEPIWIP